MIISILFIILSWFCFSRGIVPLAFAICATIFCGLNMIFKLIILCVKFTKAVNSIDNL